jgi:hypothetical protein
MTTLTGLQRGLQRGFQRLLCGAAAALLLSACASTPAVVQKPKIEEAMAQAAVAANSGQKEKALTLLKGATTAFPADKAPWLQLAQMKYDDAQYGEAIINAQEVLVRDPSDKLANSIVAISGLRLSTRALADLSRQNNLSGSLRTESQDLAKLLRESLGESVLVQPREKPAARSSRKAAKRAENRAEGRSDGDAGANPFDALK